VPSNATVAQGFHNPGPFGTGAGSLNKSDPEGIEVAATELT